MRNSRARRGIFIVDEWSFIHGIRDLWNSWIIRESKVMKMLNNWKYSVCWWSYSVFRRKGIKNHKSRKKRGEVQNKLLKLFDLIRMEEINFSFDLQESMLTDSADIRTVQMNTFVQRLFRTDQANLLKRTFKNIPVTEGFRLRSTRKIIFASGLFIH